MRPDAVAVNAAPERRRLIPEQLQTGAPLLVALWGWAALGLAIASLPPVILMPIVGFVASASARRSPRLTALVELAALGVVVALAPPSALGFVVAGAVLVLAARALGIAIARAGR